MGFPSAFVAYSQTRLTFQWANAARFVAAGETDLQGQKSEGVATGDADPKGQKSEVVATGDTRLVCKVKIWRSWRLVGLIFRIRSRRSWKGPLEGGGRAGRNEEAGRGRKDKHPCGSAQCVKKDSLLIRVGWSLD